ncbi:MAG: Tetratricopeptide 2 [Chthonomonadales bacterium]|nr:Tetratricopeptide 2 [Chthonomonadales bacterium]
MTLAAARRTALFNAPPDNAAQRTTLACELHTAGGFTLIFAVYSRWEEAKRQREALLQECTDLRIQELDLLEATPHLLDFLRAHLETPLPDAVFIYGLENWIPDTAAPKSVPFLLNLNASRDYFSSECPCPLVFWIPEYLFGLILRDAPDFASVRSGFYYFAAPFLTVPELDQTVERLEQHRAKNLTGPEKEERLVTLSALLAQTRALPEERRDSNAEIRILDGLAETYAAVGRYGDAALLLEQELEITRAEGNRPHLGAVLNNLGFVYYCQGRWEEAIACHQQALSIKRELQNRVGEGQTLNKLGNVYSSQERWAEAIEMYQKSLSICREFQDRVGEGQALNNLGSVYYSQGRWAEAVEAFEQSLSICREFQDRVGEEQALNNLGSVYSSQGRWAEAIEMYQKSLSICREFQDRIGEGRTLNNLGNVYASQGRWAEAIEVFQQSLSIRREFQDRVGEGRTLFNLALLKERQEDYPEALALVRQALQVLETTEDEKLKARASSLLSRLEMRVMV